MRKNIIIETITGYISLTVDKGAGRLTSGLIQVEDCALDMLESIVLAHACAGVDIETEEYIEGINTTLEAWSNNK